MRLVFAALFLTLALPTQALPLCEFNFLKRSSVDKQVLQSRFEEVMAELSGLGLKHLTKAWVEKRLQVTFQGKRSGREADLSWPVLFKRQKLIIRKLEWKSEAERQKSIWEIAKALYVLEARKCLWSMKTIATPNLERELNLQDENDLLAYFAVEQPEHWRDSYIKHTSDLEADMYTLLDHLKELKPEDVLPKKDPGRNWMLFALLGMDSSSRIAPNLRDYLLREKDGQSAVNAAVNERHSRSVLANHYLDHLRRFTLVSLIAAPLLAAAPYVLPDMYPEPAKQEQQVQRAPNPQQQVWKNKLDAEKRRLESAIKVEQGKLYPNMEEIQRLSKEL